MDNQDNTRWGGAIGPHAPGTAVRHVVDDLNAEGRGVGSKNRKTTPATTSTTPVRQLLGPANAETHHKEHGLQRPSERSNPMQHAKGRTGDCPGPRNEMATRRNVTRGGGGIPMQQVTLLHPVLHSRK